jgi:hypothetical protein
MDQRVWLVIAVVAGCNGGAATGTKTETGTGTTGSDTQTTDGTTPTGAYHPAGWADPAAHGPVTKLQNGVDDNGGDCRSCHGQDLEGGTGPACSSCHGADWKTDCTFCHGDPANGTGAPPRDINDESDPALISFPEHAAHVYAPTIHAAYDCTMCHDKPADALASGHVFDDTTHGQAEVQFPSGSYNAGTCTVYCHGDGTGVSGSVSIGDGPLTCGSCHPSAPSNGQHSRHASEGFDCATCHPDVNGAGDAVTDPAPHVDYTRTVELPSGMTWNGSNETCSGTCHFELHSNRGW